MLGSRKWQRPSFKSSNRNTHLATNGSGLNPTEDQFSGSPSGRGAEPQPGQSANPPQPTVPEIFVNTSLINLVSPERVTHAPDPAGSDAAAPANSAGSQPRFKMSTVKAEPPILHRVRQAQAARESAKPTVPPAPAAPPSQSFLTTSSAVSAQVSEPVPPQNPAADPVVHPISSTPRVTSTTRPLAGLAAGDSLSERKAEAAKAAAQATAEMPGSAPLSADLPGNTEKLTQADARSGGETEPDEIVLGRRQLAGVLFVLVAALVIFVFLAYMAGKGSAREANGSTLGPLLANPSQTMPGLARPAPVAAPNNSTTQNQVELPKPAIKPSPPIFGVPQPGARYLRTAVVDKGVAILLTQGLRAHGLEAFATPGSVPRTFRVLIGPLVDQTAFLKAKDTADDLDLPTTLHK